MKELAARLLAKRVLDGECWVFDGAKDRDGYGRIAVSGVNTPAHRAAWSAFRGDPGAEHVLRNEGCVSRACFNPDHLHLGAHTQNMIERDAWGAGIRGERVATAKLEASDVLAIRHLRSKGFTCKAIADRFGVKPTTVSHIALRRTWRHI